MNKPDLLLKAPRRRNPRAGVTLIEMLVVVTIIALFAAIVGPKEQISAFQLALGQYKLDTGNYPTTEQGLAALRAQPQGVEQWHGPYLTRDLGNDPWAHPYVYKFPGDHGDEPDIVSLGADGAPGGEGLNADVVSWK